jgi:hypothetical protein
MMQIKLYVCACVCEHMHANTAHVCVFIYICVLCMHIYTWIHHGSLSSSGRDQYGNSCITHRIETLRWKLPQPNKHHQFMQCEYFPFNYMQPFSYSFPLQTVCACYVHSPYLLVWVLIMLSDEDLIHLFVENDILECRIQNINVTSLLIELTFTQMLKL